MTYIEIDRFDYIPEVQLRHPQQTLDQVIAAGVALISSLERLAFAMHEDDPLIANGIAALLRPFEDAVAEGARIQ